MAVFELGGFRFPSKKEAQDLCRRILHAYPLGATVEGRDAVFILSVLENHGNAEGKIGCGVSSFQVQADGYGHRCFWLTRVDGSRTYFSYLWCFKKPPGPEQRARLAFRCEVQDQVIAFKKFVFASAAAVRCACSGVEISWPEAHVDHEPPFHVLRDSFLAQAGAMSLAEVAVQPWREGEHRYLFVDRALAAAWSSYHAAYARLRVISAEENLKKGGAG